MKRIFITLLFIFIIIFTLTTSNLQPALAESNKQVRVMVAYHLGQKEIVKGALNRAGAQMHYEFDELSAFALTLPVAALDGVIHNPHVDYVEGDHLRYLDEIVKLPIANMTSLSLAGSPYDEQVVPYGVDMVQARDLWDSDRDGIVDPGVPTGAGKTICIIDSGLYTVHEDFSGVNVMGGWPTTGFYPWDVDGLGHGTHVAGTITAQNNGVGVVGVTPGTADIYIVRVFSENGAWVNTSDLIEAANVCASNDSDIISMSLSGERWSRTEERAFNEYYNQGILSVAAASNDGVSTYHYPASYDSVISVGALDSSMTWADFSNFNPQVELAAPGVGVLSTVPFIETNTVTVEDVTYYGNYIDYAARGTVSGALANGALCGTADPSAWSGKVVLCQRGSFSFAEKVLNVQTSGGLAALIYNNEPGNFLGTLEPQSSTIPALSLTQADGQYLVSNKLGTIASVVSSTVDGSGYEAWNGTSMATPHVSAAAALVWSCSPGATNVQVRDALTSTALDLGGEGRDDYYGFGLVQAKDACSWLNPTAVTLLSFSAESGKKSVILKWETANEVDNLGFNLYRSTTQDGERVKINPELIPTNAYPGALIGATYDYIDTGADLKQRKLLPNRTYYYWLDARDIFGGSQLYGPIAGLSLAK